MDIILQLYLVGLYCGVFSFKIIFCWSTLCCVDKQVNKTKTVTQQLTTKRSVTMSLTNTTKSQILK